MHEVIPFFISHVIRTTFIQPHAVFLLLQLRKALQLHLTLGFHDFLYQLQCVEWFTNLIGVQLGFLLAIPTAADTSFILIWLIRRVLVIEDLSLSTRRLLVIRRSCGNRLVGLLLWRRRRHFIFILPIEMLFHLSQLRVLAFFLIIFFFSLHCSCGLKYLFVIVLIGCWLIASTAAFWL